jgi:hypothetical protein
MKRGRKSRNQLELTDTLLVDVTRRMPAPPPPELTDAQAQVWRDAVSSMPGNWLQRGAYAVLTEYCRHVCRARLLEAQVARFEEEWLKADGGLERFDKLLAMADREGKAALACARALRLTPQAQMHPRTAGRMANDVSPYPSPWNFGRGRILRPPSTTPARSRPELSDDEPPEEAC